MQENLIATKEIADKIGLNYLTVLNRGALLNLEPRQINRTFYWTKTQLEQIEQYQKKYKTRINTTNRFSKEKITIVELFLSSKNNSCSEIARKTGKSRSFVNTAINEYLKTKTITVESKMNL